MTKKGQLLVSILSIITTVFAVALTVSSRSGLLKPKGVWAETNVSTPYSLLLDASWGYNKEASKEITSRGGNKFSIGFSNDGTNFGTASGMAFTTTEDGEFIYNTTVLNGVSEIYVKGTSTNDKTGITVYAHYDEQTYCTVGINDQRIIGTLNSLIKFEPAKYVTIRVEGTDNVTSVEIGYNCNEPSEPIFSMRGGGQNTDGNGLFQSMTGLVTESDVGSTVKVQMDVKVTGTFDSVSCEIYWVDAVWTTGGGESDKARTSVKTLIVDGSSDWHTVEFYANVRNFPNLRYNTKYVAQSTADFGNAVYLIAITHASLDSFDYRNVVISDTQSMVPGGDNGKSDKYYQSIGALNTNLAAGTAVEVTMDVYVTGTFNSYSYVYAADTVYSVAGGELNAKIDITSLVIGQEGWHTITFNATVRNFPALRYNSAYPVVDTSTYGNAVYLISQNKSADSFKYDNVSILEILAAPAAKKDSSGNYYTSYLGFPANGFAEGADVHVSLYMKFTGGIDSYTAVYALDKSVIKWGGGAYADGLNQVTVVKAGSSFPTTDYEKYEFDTKVYSHSNAIHWGASGATFDVSTYGICVLLAFKNTTNAVSPAAFKNVVITAA